MRKLTVKEVAPDMDNPQGNALEALVLDSVSDDKLISRILALPPSLLTFLYPIPCL